MPPATATAPAAPAAPSNAVDNSYLAPPPGAQVNGSGGNDQVLYQALNTNVAAQPLTAPTPGTLAPPASPTPTFTFNPQAMPTYTNPDIAAFGDNAEGLATAQNSALSELMKQQAGVQQDAFKQYNDAVASQGSALDRYNTLSQQMNIPLYQQQMTTIKGLLDRLSDDITSRVQGTFMNQGQRDNMETQYSKNLNQQLGSIGSNETAAESNLAKVMDYTTQDNATKLKPIEQYMAGLDAAFGRVNSTATSENTQGMSALQSRVAQEEKDREDALANQVAQWTQQNALADQRLKQQTLALQQRIANAGLGSAFGGIGSGAAASPAAAAGGGGNPVLDAFNLVHSYRGANGNNGGGWSGAASFLAKNGIDTSRGSAGDIALNRYFNGGGYNDYKQALQSEGRTNLLGYAW